MSQNKMELTKNITARERMNKFTGLRTIIICY